MKKISLFIFCSIALVSFGQQTNYFNTIYSNNGYNTKGFSIIDDGSGYVGYGLTTNPNVYQLFYFYKYSYAGEILMFKTFYEPYHSYYAGDVGGAMKKSADGSYYFAYHLVYNGTTYGRLMKMDQNLDTIWTKYYSTGNLWTMPWNSNETSDGGYVITGSVLPEYGDYYDVLLIKTDSLGNKQWNMDYGGNWAEQGTNAIQTPDGGYLMGGFFWKPGIDHSMDAMVVKTDNLGNEQWTKYFGNPDINDDMAFVQMASDGNYLVATVYGEEIYTSDARIGRLILIKINETGDVLWEKKFGQQKVEPYLKNFTKDVDGNLIFTGFYVETDSVTTFNYFGWSLKTNQNGDSIWMHDYYHFNELYDENLLYDIAPTSDNGYIAIGQSKEAFTQSNMWAIKLDSMGCDTPGCATGVFVEEFSPSRGGRGEVLTVYPNPASKDLKVKGWGQYAKGEKRISVFDIYGRKTKETSIPKNTEALTINVQPWNPGLYFLRLTINGKAVGSAKVVVE